MAINAPPFASQFGASPAPPAGGAPAPAEASAPPAPPAPSPQEPPPPAYGAPPAPVGTPPPGYAPFGAPAGDLGAPGGYGAGQPAPAPGFGEQPGAAPGMQMAGYGGPAGMAPMGGGYGGAPVGGFGPPGGGFGGGMSGGAEVNTTLPLILGFLAVLPCCSGPIGIAALVIAILARKAKEQGNIEDARKKAKIATILAAVGIGLSLFSVIGWLVSMILQS